LTSIGNDTDKFSKKQLRSISESLERAETAKQNAEKNDYYPAINKA